MSMRAFKWLSSICLIKWWQLLSWYPRAFIVWEKKNDKLLTDKTTADSVKIERNA